jgi:hypothetical protein
VKSEITISEKIKHTINAQKMNRRAILINDSQIASQSQQQRVITSGGGLQGDCHY